MTFGGDFHRWKIVAVSDHQLAVLAQILLRPNAFLNLPLEFCGMNLFCNFSDSQWMISTDNVFHLGNQRFGS
jgi:hypothetical protein